MGLSRFIYFGMRFSNATDGAWGYLVDETKSKRSDWDEVASAILNGDNVHIRPADADEMAVVAATFATEQVIRGARTGENLTKVEGNNA